MNSKVDNSEILVIIVSVCDSKSQALSIINNLHLVIKLENVVIANALQLEAAPDATPVLFRFNHDALLSLKSLNLYPLPYYSLFAADTLLYAVSLTLEPVTLTFDM